MASSVVLGQSLANSIFTSGRNSAGSGQMHVKESVNCWTAGQDSVEHYGPAEGQVNTARP